MTLYDMDGNELTKDPDISKGRFLPDENDPSKMIFSPWDTVPLRPEENPNHN